MNTSSAPGVPSGREIVEAGWQTVRATGRANCGPAFVGTPEELAAHEAAGHTLATAGEEGDAPAT